jgi:hypothetical protein
MSRPLSDSLAYARDIRALRAVVIEPAGLARGEVLVIEVATGREAVSPIETLMAAPGRLVEPAVDGACA